MIVWQGKTLPSFYLFIYKLFREKAKNRIFVSYHDIKEILNRKMYHIPKPFHFMMLKEMEELGMIKKIGNNRDMRYELVGRDIDKLLNQYNILF